MKTGFVIALLAIATLCASAMAQENTAEDWYKKGLELDKKGSYEEAVKAYDKAIEIAPQNATFWFAKGQSLLSTTYGPIGIRGQERTAAEETAIEAYDKAVQIDPNDTDAWICKGFILLRIATRNSTVDMDMCNESLYSFDKALELNPKDTNAWQGRGTLLFALNEVEEAIESYDRALESDPSNIGASQGRAQALAVLGMNEESAQTYDKSLETVDREIEVANSYENLSQAWLMKGIVLQEQGRNEDAVKALDNATNADPKNEIAWKVKGYVLSAMLERYNEAVEAFDKALQINSKDPLTWQRKGDALKALGRNSEAGVAFNKAKELGYETSTKNSTNSQTKASSTSVKTLAITSIRAAGKDKSVEMTNSLTEAQNFKGCTLNINNGRNQSLALPDFTLGPGKKVNIHFGSGKTNETDLFLNSSISLNDTAGNITLKNETGKTAASFGYRVEPDGSVTGIMVAKGEFSYPQSEVTHSKS